MTVNWTNGTTLLLDVDLITDNLTDDGGGSTNATTMEGAETGIVNWFLHILVAFILAVLILVTAIGNVFVIAVILLERHLQSVANYLILSLAAADLLVAVLVMPLGAVYQVTGKWVLGPELCDMWTSSDVLCCTASILHLVAIATDRYWAVTSIDYIQKRTFKRITVMIIFVWIISALVSVCPLFGWKDPDWDKRIQVYQLCLISQDVGYQVFATLSTFYVPLAIILGLYWRIFVTAKKRIRRRNKQQAGSGGNAAGGRTSGGGIEIVRPPGPASIAMTSAAGTTANGTAAGISLVTAETACTIIAAAAGVLELGRISKVQQQQQRQQLPSIEEPCCSSMPSAGDDASDTNNHQLQQPSPKQQQQQHQHQHQQSPSAKSGGNKQRQHQQQSMAAVVAASVNNKRRNMESKRERKAAKTLAIITGAFVVCWLPFFVVALLMPLCSTCVFDDNMVAVFLWLGYFNSTLNPILYTIFSPEFRNAFQKLLRIKRNRGTGETGGASGTPSGMARARAAAADGRPDVSSVHTGLLPVSAIGTTTTTTSYGRRSSVHRFLSHNNSSSKIEVDRQTSMVTVSVNYSA